MDRTAWQITPDALEETFHPEGLRVLSPQLTLVGGWFEEPDGATSSGIFRVREGQAELTFESAGKVIALDARGQAVWAVVAVGADHHALCSEDAGRTWQHRGLIGAEVYRILAVDGEQLWLLARNALLRTEDGGETWLAVEAPGDRHVGERLCLQGEEVLLLAQDCLLSTRDGGVSWSQVGLEGGRACAFSDGALLTYHGPYCRLGLREGGNIRWLGRFERAMEPFRLIHDEVGMVFLALPMTARAGAGVWFFQSEDQGESWSSALIPCRCLEGAADLGQDGVGRALDGRGRLITLTA